MLLQEFLQFLIVEGLVDVNVQIVPTLNPCGYQEEFIHRLNNTGPSCV
jgi:hypothetical protein